MEKQINPTEECRNIYKKIESVFENHPHVTALWQDNEDLYFHCHYANRENATQK